MKIDRSQQLVRTALAILLAFSASAKVSAKLNSDYGFFECQDLGTCDAKTKRRIADYNAALKSGDIASDIRVALTFWRKALAIGGDAPCLKRPIHDRIVAANKVINRYGRPTHQQYQEAFDAIWIHDPCDTN